MFEQPLRAKLGGGFRFLKARVEMTPGFCQRERFYVCAFTIPRGVPRSGS